MRRGFIFISKETNILVWIENKQGVFYSLKQAYAFLWTNINYERRWWWHEVWKASTPRKKQNLVWLILKNKMLTWDMLRKKYISGPSICSLCMREEENIDHIFIQCQFSRDVWEEIRVGLQTEQLWTEDLVEKNLKMWYEKKELRSIKCVPFLTVWDLWRA